MQDPYSRGFFVRVCWLSHTKVASVIIRGGSRRTSSRFPPSPSHNTFRNSYHARRGATQVRRKTQALRLGQNCYNLTDMPACTLLYSTLLYYTIRYYTILYYTILYYTILYYTILYYTILYSTILYYIILYYTVLYYTLPYYAILWTGRSPARPGPALPGSGGTRSYSQFSTINRYYVLVFARHVSFVQISIPYAGGRSRGGCNQGPVLNRSH